jgi:3-oxoadipate enol-lactonase
MIDIASAVPRYRLDGPTHAPLLLLANSLGTRLELWEGQMPELTRHFHVLRYDLRGHGPSALGLSTFGLERLGQDVIALLDGLQVPRVHFCGLSLGGAIGAWLGAHAPERLDRLVLCNTAATFGRRSAWDARIEAVAKGGMAAITPTVIARWFTPEFREREPDAVEVVQRMLLANDPDGYMSACAAVRDIDQRTSVAEVRAPTLVVAGACDRVTPPSEARWLAQQIAGARYVELAAAHLSNIEARAPFNAELLDFLRG